jgi:hypothetical protein
MELTTYGGPGDVSTIPGPGNESWRLPMHPQSTPRRGAVTRICGHCGQQFSIFAARVRQGRGLFCSQRCGHAGQRRDGPTARPLAERFWTKVTRSSDPEGCCVWTGRRNARGYGVFDTPDGPQLAHRVAWEITRGPLDPEEVLRHVVCRNRPCVRPGHTAPGSQTENMADMARDGVRKGERHHLVKLTEAAVLEIRALRAAGVKERTVARRFGVAPGTIGSIARGESWGHLSGGQE